MYASDENTDVLRDYNICNPILMHRCANGVASSPAARKNGCTRISHIVDPLGVGSIHCKVGSDHEITRSTVIAETQYTPTVATIHVNTVHMSTQSSNKHTLSCACMYE